MRYMGAAKHWRRSARENLMQKVIAILLVLMTSVALAQHTVA